MTEKLSLPEQTTNHEKQGESLPNPEAAAERSHNEAAKPDTEQARKVIETAALKTEDVKPKAENHKTHSPQHVDRKTKELVYERTLLQLRRHLPPASRLGSKIIHQRAVEVVSEAAGKTVARPSGLLSGGLVALLGTAAYYFVMVRHYGFGYSNTVYLVLLAGGFIIGWLIEALFKSLKRSR